MRKVNPITLFFFLTVATIPLLSGAIHPLIQALYTFLIFLTSGIWLILNFDSIRFKAFTFKPYLVFTITGFIILTTVTLPLDIVELLSPVRAKILTNALETGQLRDITTSLTYYNPGSRYYAVYVLTLLIFFFFASAFLRLKENLKIILWFFTFTGTTQALYFLLQLIVPLTGIPWLPAWMSTGALPGGTFMDHNHFAAFMNMCWPVSLVLGISMTGLAVERSEMLKITKKNLTTKDRLKLLFYKANIPYWCSFIMIMSVILSRSVAGIVIMILLILLCRIVIPFPRRIKVIISAAFYLTLLVYGLMLGIQGINNGIFIIPKTVMAKYHFWAESLIMLKEHLITGIGMGSYKYMAPLYLPGFTESRLLTHAYNEYIELTIELGLPAMILFVGWIFAGLFSPGKRIARMPHKIKKMTRDEIIIIGSFCSILGSLLHAVVDNIWHIPAIALYTVTILAVLTTIMEKEKTGEPYSPEQIFPGRKNSTFVPYTGKKRRTRN